MGVCFVEKNKEPIYSALIEENQAVKWVLHVKQLGRTDRVK